MPAVSTTDQGEERVLAIVMHATFYVLLGASLARFLIRHPGSPQSGWVLALSGLLALLYVAGGGGGGGGGRGGEPGGARRGGFLVIWVEGVGSTGPWVWKRRVGPL